MVRLLLWYLLLFLLLVLQFLFGHDARGDLAGFHEPHEDVPTEPPGGAKAAVDHGQCGRGPTAAYIGR